MKLRPEGSTVASFTSIIVLFIFPFFTIIFSFCIEYVLFREKNYYTHKRDGGSDQWGVLWPKQGEQGICEGEGTAEA